jgi:hypothetical protein
VARFCLLDRHYKRQRRYRVPARTEVESVALHPSGFCYLEYRRSFSLSRAYRDRRHHAGLNRAVLSNDRVSHRNRNVYGQRRRQIQLSRERRRRAGQTGLWIKGGEMVQVNSGGKREHHAARRLVHPLAQQHFPVCRHL